MIFWESVVYQISFLGKKGFYRYLLKYNHTVQLYKKTEIAGDIIQNVMANFRQRCEACLEASREAFEHFLD